MMNNKFTFLIIIAFIAVSFAISVPKSSFAAEKEEAGTGENLQNSSSSWQGALESGETDHTIGCLNIGANLTSTYDNNPCDVTEIYADYSSAPPGGQKLTEELEKWWVDEGVPTLRQLTAQISGFIYTQTQMLAITFDGFIFNRYAKAKQQEEYLVRKRYKPNEYTCVASSNISALAKARNVSEQLTESFKMAMERRANGIKDTTGSQNKKIDLKSRWDNYCTYFKDPLANDGETACENPDDEGSAKNADIDIEGFLFQDTIDMSREDIRTAVKDIFINLHQNKIGNKASTHSTENINSIDKIFRKQHIAAVRNSAAHVIASIIARRAPVTYETLSGITSGDLIKEIRLNAGIPDGDGTEESPIEISTNPSYNELMLALTKERFLDPTYYIRVQSSLPAIQKEQATVEGYVNMQLNDIYQLQEQINMLIAAKTALNAEKLNVATLTTTQSSEVDSVSTSDTPAP